MEMRYWSGKYIEVGIIKPVSSKSTALLLHEYKVTEYKSNVKHSFAILEKTN